MGVRRLKVLVLALAFCLVSPFYSFAEGIADSTEPSVSLASATAQKYTTTATSRLAHIRSSSAIIFKTIGDQATAFKAGSTYTGQVYYIKRQAIVKDRRYYLLSTKPSSTEGVIGWAAASDLVTYAHVSVDKDSKTFYINNGVAYNRAWGDQKNIVIADLSQYQLQAFQVNLTEKVGNNVWYRGTLNGKTIWLHSSHVWTGTESATSRLAHIAGSSVKIYQKIGDDSTAITAGSQYTDQGYYIKKQMTIGGHIFYLLSTKPSSTEGVIGWAAAGDLVSYANTAVDEHPKTFYIKSGVAYDRPFGDKKNIAVADLSAYQLEAFEVNRTEKVGSNKWYRGILDGKTIWLHSSHVWTGEESATSRLAHILHSNVEIYPKMGDRDSAITAGSAYIDQVFYIKKQLVVGGRTFYLLSNQPSSETGVVGWVEDSDLLSYTHTSVDKKAKTFYIKGIKKAYGKIWGGSKNVVYPDLSVYQYQEFRVNLTNKVGDNLWYRGTLNGKTVWLHESYLIKPKAVVKNYTTYNLSLSKMVDIQMAVNPQTDKHYPLWIKGDAFSSIVNGKGTVKGNWNLRRGPGVNYHSDAVATDGKVYTIAKSAKAADGSTWYQVSSTSGWVTPNESDVKYYLDYTNFTDNLKASLQFLILSQLANVNVKEVNEKVLLGKGILSGRAQAFVDGAKKYGVNEIYLISHALLETGNGTSELANGIEVGKDSKGNAVIVTSKNRSSLTGIKKTYNMYGINATDACVKCGATYAYNQGWFTPDAAIIGGAAFIGNGYIHNGQDTLYKMRWNPAFAATAGYASHQYASDIGWAYKQTASMYNIYSLLDDYILVLDLPKYK